MVLDPAKKWLIRAMVSVHGPAREVVTFTLCSGPELPSTHVHNDGQGILLSQGGVGVSLLHHFSPPTICEHHKPDSSVTGVWYFLIIRCKHKASCDSLFSWDWNMFIFIDLMDSY